MVELFAKSETSATFRAHTDKLISEINVFSDEKILGANIDEWINYYFDEYKILPITLFLDNVSQTLTETKVEKYNPWYKTDPYESKTFKIDGFKITFTIPFDGDDGLLLLRPSRYYMKTFSADRIIKGDDTSYGSIIISLEYTKQELEGKETPDFIASQFSNEFKSYAETIDTINKEVEQFNKSLPEIIKNALATRKKKADDYVSMSEKLSIPLKINPNAPSITPVPMKKVTAKKPEMPSARPRDKEYAISLDNYDNIRKIVYTAGSSMERAASTYAKLSEEELRDIILSHLNSHYENSTGETFSKIGKTDIHIPFENKAAYIAECKIWHGEKNLQSAFEQLTGYTTWRDVRTSIIVLNKNNKDFTKVLDTVNGFMDGNALCQKIERNNLNEWHCTFKKSAETAESMEIQFVVFDIFIP